LIPSPLDPLTPRWLRDLERFLPLKSQFVLSGNVRDLQLTSASGAAIPQALVPHLAHELNQRGYSQVLLYEPFHGFSIVETDSQGSADELLQNLGLEPSNGCAPAGLELFAQVIERLVEREGPPLALIVDFASRLVTRPEALSATEHQAFTRALMASHRARSRPVGQPPRPFFNTVMWIVEKEGDLPDWLLVSNPRVRHVPIARPDHHGRRALGKSLVRTLEGATRATPQRLDEALDELVDSTEGLLFADIAAIVQLGRSEGLSFERIGDAVRRYKVGVTEDPWARIEKRKIATAFETITDRVRGQPHAVTHVLDIIKRAVTGVGATRRGGRPRGVAFLAGPTGVGKTELAKTITELLFGDESAYIRFDMSEFSAEHSDQRLIGAPPGYVGYDVGGELTNAVREKPFAVVLFDEIEKAHPRILDKFLQILDDGVLTSGRGDRVYFSEALVIFTSNLGIYRTDEHGQRVLNIQPSEPLDEIRKRVRVEIDHHFKVVLNRPEILNRIGENIVVFDFIRDRVAIDIFDGMVSQILKDLEVAQQIRIELSADVQNALRTLCLHDLSNGGRGIRNQVEIHLVNPLARALFDAQIRAGQRVHLDKIETGAVTSLGLSMVR
jgi:ATP-dependent Clp protease ATP-binding subunit ClpA